MESERFLTKLQDLTVRLSFFFFISSSFLFIYFLYFRIFIILLTAAILDERNNRIIFLWEIDFFMLIYFIIWVLKRGSLPRSRSVSRHATLLPLGRSVA